MKELVGPWLFGVGLFASLLMAATYLNRIVGFFVDQVPLPILGQLILLLFPAILVKTFTMAVLLAALLAFGRLSSDSEVVALRAGGASIFRIVVPVMAFSFIIALVTLWFDEQVVPSATQRSKSLQDQIIASKGIKVNQPFARPIVQDGKLKATIAAENVDILRNALEGVTIISYGETDKLGPNGKAVIGKDGKPVKEVREQYYLHAKEIVYEGLTQALKNGFGGSLSHWRVQGGMTLVPADYSNVIHSESAWPDEVPTIPQSFADLTADRKDEFDLMSMNELKQEIEKHRQLKDWTPAEISNGEYGYWNKLSVPLAAFVFGTLGAVLGIRNHRTGTASGFALAIAIIFGYVTLANFMNVWASGGVLPAYVASFAPISLGFIASGIIMWRRNA